MALTSTASASRCCRNGPGEAALGRPGRRHRASSPPGTSPIATVPRKHLAGGGEEGDDLGAGQGRGQDLRVRRQSPRIRPGEASRHLECVVHHQLPGAGGEGDAATSFGFVRGFMTTVHSYTNDQHDPRPAAQGPAPRARRRAVDHPDVDRGRQGHRTGDSRSQGQDRRHCAAGADRRRLDRRPDLHRREGHHRRGQSTPRFVPPRPTGRSRAFSFVSDEPLVSADYIGNLASSTVDVALDQCGRRHAGARLVVV